MIRIERPAERGVEVFSVKRYGAKGDGVTDDTSAIQAAIDAAEAATYGGVVYLPAGNYRVSSTLTVQADNITIQGAGMGNVVGGAGVPALGGSFLRPTSAFTGTYILDVSQAGTPDRALEAVYLKDFSIDGVNTVTTSGGYVTASSPTLTGIRFMVFNGGMFYVRVKRVGADGILMVGNGATAYPDGNWDNRLFGCKVETVGDDAITFESYATDNILTGCIVEYATGDGISFDSSSTGNQLIGSDIYNCKGSGVNGATARALKFVGNRFIDCSGGIYLAGGASGGDFVIVGNSFRSCSYNADNAYDGVNITASAAMRGGIIEGNAFSTLQRNGPANRMRYGVNIASANVTDVTIGPMTEGYVSPATSTFGTGRVSDSGTSTRIVTGEQVKLVSGAKIGSGSAVAPQVLAQSAVAVSHTGDTTETTLATITIPGGVMGLNGRLRVTTQWSVTNSANNKQMRVRFGGATGQPYLNQIVTTVATLRHQAEIANRNATNSQVGGATATGGWGTATGAITTSTLDTAFDQTIVMTAQLSSSTETITLEGYVVEVLA